MAVYSAKLRGASVIYAVDYVRDRLNRAAALGAVPIDFTSDEGIASQQILRRRPEGVMHAVDCVGFEAVNHRLRRDQSYVINETIAVTSVNGGVGLIGVYATSPTSESAPRGGEIDPIFEINLSSAWVKNLTIRSGIAPEFVNLPVLFDLVRTRRVDLDFVVSSVMSIEDAPKAYERFEKHLETKVVFRFPWTEQQADNVSTPIKAEEKVEPTNGSTKNSNPHALRSGNTNSRIVKPENGLTVQSTPGKKSMPL
jgi:threonine dehydrogenase-like Zn-dependent dehydrogenase